MPREARLASALAALPPGYFAVLDGARDPNLAFHLRAWNLTPLPLYLEAVEEEAVWSGPVLVELPAAAIHNGWLPLPPMENVTFWSWPDDALSLRRHLRSINLVDVPAETVFPNGEGRHTVMFRHWDANVLASILPLLSAEQYARVWGKAQGLVIDADDFGGTHGIERPRDLPAKPRGMLAFDLAQVSALSDVRVATARRRIAAYLREVAPAQTQALDDAALTTRIAGWEQEAKAFGIVSERDIGRWSFLQCMTGGTLLTMPGVGDYMQRVAADHGPGPMLDTVFAEVEHGLRRGI